VGHDKQRFTVDPEYSMLKKWCGDWQAYQCPFKVKDRLIIYTAIAGRNGRDQLADPEPIPGVDYVCLTDQGFNSKIWEMRPFAWIHQQPVRIAKHPKILPHRYFPDHDLSVWVDGNIAPGIKMADAVKELLLEHNMAIHRHPRRSCLYREAETIIAHQKDDPVLIEKIVLRYLAREGVPHEAGLYEGGIIYRRHHDPDIKRAMELWWQEIDAGSNRDQLSLPYVIIKTGLKLKIVDCNLRVTPYATFRAHEDLRWKGERG
jgi:hypothetical protein